MCTGMITALLLLSRLVVGCLAELQSLMQGVSDVGSGEIGLYGRYHLMLGWSRTKVGLYGRFMKNQNITDIICVMGPSPAGFGRLVNGFGWGVMGDQSIISYELAILLHITGLSWLLLSYGTGAIGLACPHPETMYFII